jgi:hypothetical protein
MEVASLAETFTQDLVASVANELPSARGQFAYSNAAGGLNLWLLNQAATGPQSPLLLSPNPGVVNLRAKGGVSLTGATSAVTGALGAGDRRVETTATTSFKDLRIMPTSFIQGPNFERSVVLIDDFSASVTCKSTALAATSVASATWQATVYYWVENDPNDGQQRGHYESVAASSSAGTDPLAAIKAANPMVYEDPTSNDPAGSPNDIYLFPVGHDHGGVVHDHPGYLVDWSSLPVTAAQMDSSGRTTSADINGAIRIDTAPTNPDVEGSGVNVSVAKLTCEAVDNR